MDKTGYSYLLLTPMPTNVSLSCLFITRDIAVVSHVAYEIAAMHQGWVVEGRRNRCGVDCSPERLHTHLAVGRKYDETYPDDSSLGRSLKGVMISRGRFTAFLRIIWFHPRFHPGFHLRFQPGVQLGAAEIRSG